MSNYLLGLLGQLVLYAENILTCSFCPCALQIAEQVCPGESMVDFSRVGNKNQKSSCFN